MVHVEVKQLVDSHISGHNWDLGFPLQWTQWGWPCVIPPAWTSCVISGLQWSPLLCPAFVVQTQNTQDWSFKEVVRTELGDKQ